jgi:uncharacterized protein (DUF885 family)
MKKRKLSGFIIRIRAIGLRATGLCLLMLAFSGCGSSSSSSTEPSNPIVLDVVPDYTLQNTQTLLSELDATLDGLTLDDFYDASFKAIELRDHQAIIAAGRTEEFSITDYQLDNISDDYYFQTVAIKQHILDKLLSYDTSQLTANEQLAYDIYLTYLNFEVEWADYRSFEFPATFGFFGWPASTEGYFTQVFQVTDNTSAELYLSLLNQLERRFQQIEQLLDTRQQQGVIEPKITLGFSRDAVRAMANTAVTQTPYYTVFNNAIAGLSDISNDDKQTMRDTLAAIIEQRVLPAYHSLDQTMTSLHAQAPNAIGFGQYDGGDAFYQFSLRYFTATNQTPDDIHQLGLQEMDRIHSELRSLFNQLGYPANETIAQGLNRARTDGGTIAGNNAVSFFEEIIDDAYALLPQAFSTIPQQEVVVIGGTSGGYYIAGSEDGTRPGAFYAQTNSNLPYYTMPTLAYHEAVPGHHLQIALAQELDLPRFRREMHFTSFIEGWGLYAERLAKELGWYNGDIYGDIGRLEFEAMRASRLVIDTGIHSKGWSFNQAEQYSLQAIGNRGSIARYSVWPGQATAYMTGMLKILEVRARAEAELGADYDIREFHEAVIGNGSIPANLLDQVVDNYIDSVKTP